MAVSTAAAPPDTPAVTTPKVLEHASVASKVPVAATDGSAGGEPV